MVFLGSSIQRVSMPSGFGSSLNRFASEASEGMLSQDKEACTSPSACSGLSASTMWSKGPSSCSLPAICNHQPELGSLWSPPLSSGLTLVEISLSTRLEPWSSSGPERSRSPESVLPSSSGFASNSPKSQRCCSQWLASSSALAIASFRTVLSRSAQACSRGQFKADSQSAAIHR